VGTIRVAVGHAVDLL
jgi:hypothetical protein